MCKKSLKVGFAQVVDVTPIPDGWWVSLWDIEAETRISGEFREAVDLGELVQYSANEMVDEIKVIQECDFPNHLLDKLPIYRGSYDDFLATINSFPKF